MGKRCCGCMQIKTQSPLCEICGYNENIDNLSHQLSVDTVLNGRFRLGKVLGQGGFGITYIGWDEKEDVPVAVKEYYPKSAVERNTAVSRDIFCRDAEGQEFFLHHRDQFLQEAKLLETFADVPQIVHVKTVFEENNTVYMAMEHVRGTDLRMYIRMAGLLTVSQTFQIFRPVIQALSRVHESGLVHKDISPDNIMILPNGQAKLLDFGAAQNVRHREKPGTENRSAVAVVKQGFAPPEQYRMDGVLGPWTDVYALCATIYYCLTGKVPKPAMERQEDKRLNWETVTGLTAAQIAALEKGMEPMAADRFRNVSELYRALFPPKVETVTRLEEITDEDESPKEPVKTEKKIPSVPEKKPQPVPEQNKPPVPEKKVPPKVPKEKKPADPTRTKKLLIAAVCAAVILAAAVLLMLPRGWAEEDGTTCYYKMGSRVTGRQEIDGNTYWFGEDGAMLTGWQETDGSQRYFGSDGVMMTGTVQLDGMQYHFSEDGRYLFRICSLPQEARRAGESEDTVTFDKNNGGSQSWSYQILEQPVKECTFLAAELELTEYKNGNVDQWCFAYRDLSGQWHTLGEPFGLTDHRTKLEYYPGEPISFDAYVWYCVSVGNMWNFERSYDLTEVTVMDYEI